MKERKLNELIDIVEESLEKINELSKKWDGINRELLEYMETIGDVVYEIKNNMEIDLRLREIDSEEDKDIIGVDEDYDMP